MATGQLRNTRPGYDCYSSPWFVDGPNRNRWFTELENGESFHGYVTNNQMVVNMGMPCLRAWGIAGIPGDPCESLGNGMKSEGLRTGTHSTCVCII